MGHDMGGTLKLGIAGCGDFPRRQADDIQRSKRVKVVKMYDLRRA